MSVVQYVERLPSVASMTECGPVLCSEPSPPSLCGSYELIACTATVAPAPTAGATRRALARHPPRRDERVVRVEGAELGKAGAKLVGELAHRPESPLGLLLEGVLHRGCEPRRDIGAALQDVRHRIVEVLHGDGDEVLARERDFSGQQLVEDDPE